MAFFPELPDWYRRLLKEQESIQKLMQPMHDIVKQQQVLQDQLYEAANITSALHPRNIDFIPEELARLIDPNLARWQEIAVSLRPKFDITSDLLRVAGVNVTAEWVRSRFEETANAFDDYDEQADGQSADSEPVAPQNENEPSSIVLPSNRELILVCTEINQSMLARFLEDPVEMAKLSPRRFEELIAQLFDGFGYEVELTARTRDGGCDVIAVRRAEVTTRSLIECKRYDPNAKVGVAIVRELHGVLSSWRATNGIVATTARFSRDAKKHIEQNRWILEGRDLDGVVNWVERYLTRNDNL